MRATPLLLALFALLLATPVLAQERSRSLADDFQGFTVEDEVNLEAPQRLLPPSTDELDEADARADAEEATDRPADDAPFQQVTNRTWLYLIGAIVVAGIILAVVL